MYGTPSYGGVEYAGALKNDSIFYEKTLTDHVHLLDTITKHLAKILVAHVKLVSTIAKKTTMHALVEHPTMADSVSMFIVVLSLDLQEHAHLLATMTTFYYRKMFLAEHFHGGNTIVKSATKTLVEAFSTLGTLKKSLARTFKQSVTIGPAFNEFKIYNRVPVEHAHLTVSISKVTSRIFKEVVKAKTWFRVSGKTLELLFAESVTLHHNGMNTMVYFIKTGLSLFRPRGIVDISKNKTPDSPSEF